MDPTAPKGKLSTVGKSGYDMPNREIKQLYDSLLSTAPSPQGHDAPAAGVTYASNPGYNYSAFDFPMYADGGSVQRFADGGLADSDATTDTAGANTDLTARLAALQARAKQQDMADIMASLKNLGGLTGPPPERPRLMSNNMAARPYAPRVVPQLADLLRARGMTFAEGGTPDHPTGGPMGDYEHPNYDGLPVFRTGGGEGPGGRYVEGKGDGTSDDISAMLADGEYVFSADVVSALGNGSNKAGAERLGDMVEAIRKRARSGPPTKLSPDAKSPLEYLQSPKGKKNG